ncbi:unnamed protein product [Rotaria sp. Silwood2]|nr:unnamed protein product [Rotaria sp. Silwood2]CAF2607811.1 unnamed protein product [Rotaria sp. Silwood2]CAF2849253.1 unnamed protein product [Rotaria sp. Silwood2]CAF2905744.1 unnamed protein product [Rotaria sp. Silwood2]CAF4036622.1 unnamed protein product [Rotaria sp. Silwood2]
MAQYKVEPVGFTNVDMSSANAPAWTVPSDAVSNSDMNILMPNNNKDSPNNNEYPSPSAPDIGELPPNYFDISIVPNNAVLHYNEVTPYTEPSGAIIERKKEGVLSFDPLVDKNPDQLWLYFMTYLNEKPSLAVNIHGYHVEHYTTYEQRRSADGHYHTHAVHHTRNVTDFNFTIDLATYVTQQWWRVAVVPSKKTIAAGEAVSFRDALEQYTRSEKNIKEIKCQKQLVGWNFQELKDKIRALIYSTGYRAHIDISFPIENHRISARSSSKLSRFSNSTLVRVLCVVSCFFLIFGPIYLCLRAAGSTRDQIVADYAMVAPIDTFLHFNSGVIANAAIGRSRQLYAAYFA